MYLGTLYGKGEGVEQNYQEAYKWLKKAAEQGDPDALHGMGFIYETGQTVPQDYSKAREYYELAANLGHAKSQHNLALLYSDGRASRKMRGKRVNGMKRRRRKDSRIHNSILAQCIFWVKAAKKMNRLRGNGLKKPPFGEMSRRN